MLLEASHRTRGRHARSGLGRAARIAGIAVGALVGVIVGLLALVLLVLDTAPARSFAANEVNAILEPSFRGRIHIDRIGRLGVFGVGDADVTVDDPTGVPVLVARGVSAKVATLAVIRSALFGKREPLTIHVTSVDAEHIEANVDGDGQPQGGLRIADAFQPKTPPAPPDPNARGVRIEIHRIGLKQVRARGAPPGGPALDVDVNSLVGSFSLAPEYVEGDVLAAAVTARQIVQQADVTGLLVAHVKYASAPRPGLSGHATWAGLAGGIAHSLRASSDGDRIDAVLDAPKADPRDVRALWPASTLGAPASLHAEAHGTLPQVGFALGAGLGGGTFELRGEADLGETKSVRAHFGAERLDVHDVQPSLPQSRLAVTGDATAAMTPNGATTARLAALLEDGNVAGADLPRVTLEGTIDRTNEGALAAHAAIRIDAAYAPTRIEATMTPEGKTEKIAVDVESNVADLGDVPQLAHTVQGRVRVQAKATLHTGAMSLDADVHARAQHLVEGATRVASASLLAHASGAVADPRIDASASAAGLFVLGRHIASAHVTARGPAMAPHVTASMRAADWPDVDASADVSLAGGAAIRRVRAMLAGEGERAIATTKVVTLGEEGLRVDGLRVEGLGSPLEATLFLSGRGARIQASTQGVSLERIGHLAHMEKLVRGGMLAFDADLVGQGAGWKGRGTLDLESGSIDKWDDVSTHASFDIDGREIRGRVHAQAAGVGSVDIDVPKLAVDRLSASSWRRASGRVDVQARCDLGKLAAAMPPDTLPFSEAKGKIDLEAHLERPGAISALPIVELTVSTDGLILAPRVEEWRDIPGTRILQHPAWRLSGVDFHVESMMEGPSGKLSLDAELWDKRGQLAHLQATSDRVPYGAIYGSAPHLQADLRRTPVDLRVTVPSRGLGSLPEALKQTYLTGRLQGTATLHGTLLTPTVDVDAMVGHSRFAHGAREEFIDYALGAHYDGAHATASVEATSGDAQLLDAKIDVDAAIAGLLGGSAPPWKASMKAHLHAFPLEAIPVLDDRLVSGRLSGDLTVGDVHDHGHATAALSVDGLKVGRVSYESARAKVDANGSGLDADVRFDQPDGFFQAKAQAVTRWGAAVVPVLDPARPLHANLSAKHFRISVLLPLLEGALDELDGWLDGSTQIELDPQTRDAKLSGELSLSKGVLEAAAGGGELHDVDARLRLQPDGSVSLEKFSASGLSGHVDATGSAKLDGVRLVSAKAVVTIPSSAPLPLSGGGAEIGDVDGRFELAATSGSGGETRLVVQIPHVRVELPNGNTTSAQSLGTMARGIRVGARRGMPATFVLVPEDAHADNDASASPGGMHVHVDIADAQVVRGTDIRIDMSGKVDVAPGPSNKVTGQIHLKRGGSLSVQGHRFVVETGTVTMNPADAGNPEVVVRASWTASDGTLVYANFSGPLKTGKVTLSSEPALSQTQIVALLTTGSVTGAQSQSPSADPTVTAIGAVGGQAAQPVNHMLDQFGLSAVSVKIDSTESSAPRPEVEVQIARDISLQLAVVLGAPTPGVNPDLTLLTLDWRFADRWSLASTVGDRGTTIFDLLWRTRY